MTPISFAEAMRDPRLLGASFRGASWASWHVLAKIISGELLNEDEFALFCQCTGRTRLPDKPPRRLYLLVGRRGGKSRFLAALAVWAAALAAEWRTLMAPGESAVCALIGRDKRQAQVLRRYADGLLQAPLLAGEIERTTQERVELRSGAVLEVVTNDHRTIRSRSAIAVLGDEASFWKSDGESEGNDEEVVAAAAPSLMTAPGGGYLVLSSTTYRKRGLMYDRYREFFGKDDGGELVWLAPSATMNASLPAADIAREVAADPVKNRAEYLSEWRDDLAGFVPADVLELATDYGVKVRPPVADFSAKYFCFADAASGGVGGDSFAMAICRAGPDGVIYLDRLCEQEAPFNPSKTVEEFAQVARFYGCNVMGDHFSSGFAAAEFRRHGVQFFVSPRSKSEYYLAALPLLLSGRLRLLDHEKLRKQFAQLERTAHAGGRESVDDSGRPGAHDDLSNVVAAAAVLAAEAAAYAPTNFGGFGVVTGPRQSFPGSVGNAEDAAHNALLRSGPGYGGGANRFIGGFSR
jgi:hypothetical protein